MAQWEKLRQLSAYVRLCTSTTNTMGWEALTLTQVSDAKRVWEDHRGKINKLWSSETIFNLLHTCPNSTELVIEQK